MAHIRTTIINGQITIPVSQLKNMCEGMEVEVTVAPAGEIPAEIKKRLNSDIEAGYASLEAGTVDASAAYQRLVSDN